MRNPLLSPSLSSCLVRTALALVVIVPPMLSVACSGNGGSPSPSTGAPVEGVEPPAPSGGGGSSSNTGSYSSTASTSSSASTAPSSGSGSGSSSAVADSGTGQTDDAAASDGGVTTASFAGTYECTLSGAAQVSILGGGPQPENLPLDAVMTVTESGTAISAVITGDGGANCTVSFTDAGGGTADIGASQSCTIPITMPIQTTADISFVSAAGNDAGPPGTADLSGTTINVSLPFDVTVAGGLAMGTGVLTGACTRM